RKWADTTIPLLIKPHLAYLRKTNNLRERYTVLQDSDCACGGAQGRALKVVCVYFEELKVIELKVCACKPAALQLLRRGLFPCAPSAPSLAVDL
ncbi:hypothetical protein PLICRDRAFT_80586, partial [Plicaturopsis crispa FD-325 SS-3]